MSRRRARPNPNVYVVPRDSGAYVTPRRSEGIGPALFVAILVSLLLLVFGIATLAFWWYVAGTNLLILNDTEIWFLRAAGLLGLLVGGIGFFLTLAAFRRDALPTADLVEAAEHAAQGDYEIELQERGPRELRALTRAFNQMVNRFRADEQSRRALEREVAGALQDSFKTDEGAHALVLHDWIRLLQVETGERTIHPEPTDVSALLQETLTTLHREASERRVAVHASLPDPAVVAELDPLWLGEIVKLLVLHSLSRITLGGKVELDASETTHPDGLQVIVQDDGPALAASQLACLFTEFHTGGTLGSGLEMPLARALASSQGALLRARNGEAGGLFITLFLPFE